MNTVSVNNKSYINRNKGKVKTLIGVDEVFLDLLKFEFEDQNGTKILMNDFLNQILNNRDEINRINESLLQEIQKLTKKNEELKLALKEYIQKENEVDKMNVGSIEILSQEFAKINSTISEIQEKIKYL